jgi:hypothetical protein
VTVSLTAVADLTDAAQLQLIDTSVQELTGDWIGYGFRNPQPNTTPPYFTAVPTQQLAHAVHGTGMVEGFLTYSARVPTRRNLVVFPANFQAGSSLRYTDSHGTTHSIPPAKPRRSRRGPR